MSMDGAFGPRGTILIIEDSPEDFEACSTALSEEGSLLQDIEWCNTGDDGLDYLFGRGKYAGKETVLPSIVLLDLNLPGTDGRDVLREIKMNEKTRKLPIIVMTTSNDQVDIDHCYEAGANSFVVKPVSFDRFLVAMTRLRDYWFELAALPNSG